MVDLYGSREAESAQGPPSATLHARYVSTVSGPGADTDRIHCIWAEIQLIQCVLHLIVSEVEADTDSVSTVHYTIDTLYRSRM